MTAPHGAHRVDYSSTLLKQNWYGLALAKIMLEKLTDADLTLDSGTTMIHPVKSVRDLGVHLDSELTMKIHISKV